MRNLILAITCFTISTLSFSQGNRPEATGQKAAFQSLYELGNLGYDLKSKEGAYKDTTVVPLMIINPVQGGFSTANFALKFPGHKIQTERINIKYPEMKDVTDTLVALWFIRETSFDEEGITNVMLIGINSEERLVFYIDYNNDRDFTDYPDPYKFLDNIEQKIFEIKDGHHTYYLQLANPAFVKTENIFDKEVIVNSWLASEHGPSAHMNFSVSSGSGDAWFSYVPELDSSISPVHLVEYKANIYASAQFGGEVTFVFRNINLSVLASIEKLDIGERYRIKYYTRPDTQEIDNTIQPSTGHWPDEKFTYGVSLGYSLRVGKILRFQPYGGVSSWVLLTDEVFVKDEPNGVKDTFIDNFSYFYGAKVKVLFAKKMGFFLDFYKKHSYFNASSYFSNIKTESYDMNCEQFYVGAGLEFFF